MSLYSTPTRWGTPARLFHWVMAAGIVFMVGFGLWMTELPPSMRKLNVYALHKSVGITLLGLAALRLIWRAKDARPDEVPGQPAWQTAVAKLTHVATYALLFIIPLSGWLYNSASGFPLRWFKLVNLPRLSESDPGLKALAHTVHEYGVWTLVALVALHAGAAHKHHVIERDNTLVAMVPFLNARLPGHAPPDAEKE